MGGFKSEDTGSGGGGWNVFVETATIPLGTLAAGTVTLSFRLEQQDGFGIEYDKFTLTGSGFSKTTYTYDALGNRIAHSTSDTYPQPSIQDSIVCPGDTVAVAVTGGTSPYSYLWSDSATTDSTVAVLDSTYYHVTVTDDKGCTRSTFTFSYEALCDCLDNLTVEGQPIPPGDYEAIFTILSSGTVENGTVRFDAGESIILSNEFEVKLGAIFEAVIEGGCLNGN